MTMTAELLCRIPVKMVPAIEAFPWLIRQPSRENVLMLHRTY